MKTRNIFAVLAVLSVGTLAASAAEETKASGATGGVPEARVREIDAHVRSVEAKRTSLTRHETMLDPATLAKTTDEKWTKLHTYSDGKNVQRLKVYPTEGSQKTEEFYYDGNRLMFAFVEPKGVGNEGHDANAKGTKYYFDKNGLIAVATNGKLSAPDEKARAMGEKLQRESKAFRDAGKK